jgi:hypothetical protein
VVTLHVQDIKGIDQQRFYFITHGYGKMVVAHGVAELVALENLLDVAR